jgi:peptide/nickel transport system substrate-binding protein
MITKRFKKFLIGLFVIGMIFGLSGTTFAGDSIVRYASDWPVTLDPSKNLWTENFTVFVNLFDPLLFPDSSGKPQPHVAESWDVSPDGLAYTFHIRKGIKFHNGNMLTAEDVKFTMDRLLTIGEGPAFHWHGKITKTTVIDDYTVKFEMDQPFGPFLSTLPFFFIVNKEAVVKNIKKPGPFGDMGDYGKEYVSVNDVGSGPYMVHDHSRDEYLTMKKNPNYFLDLSSAPEYFKMIGSTEVPLLKTLFARRELELANKWQAPEAVESYTKIDGVEAASWPSVQESYITMHTKKAPLDDIHIRKALAWAFDYDVAVKLSPGAVQARGPVPQSVPGADPDAFQYHQDLDKAREELKKSKYYGKLDQYPIEIHWNDNPVQQKHAMLMMANAAKIGVTVNVVEGTFGLLEQNSSKLETTPHMHVLGDNAVYPEAGVLLEGRYHSKTAATWEQSEWLLDKDIDKMIDESYTIIDTKERLAKYREISKLIMDYCPTIFVTDDPITRAYQAAYMDWPSAQGKAINIGAYDNSVRFMTMYPEKREALLK